MDFANLQSHNTFTDVISTYQEMVQSNPTGLEPMNLTPDPDSIQSYNPTYYSAPNVPDFIADIELAAIRVLDKSELAYFKYAYKTGTVLADDPDWGSLNEFIKGMTIPVQHRATLQDVSIRLKLGQELIDSGMSSVAEYLKPAASKVSA